MTSVSPSWFSFFKECHHLFAGSGVERAGWFVRQQQAGPVDERTGDGHPLLLSTRKFLRLVACAFSQAHLRERLQRPLASRTASNVGVEKRQLNLAPGRCTRQQIKPLEYESDLLVA